MPTTLGRHEHPPQPSSDSRLRSTRRVRLLDRLALHVGVALIKWGRRPLTVARPRTHEPLDWRATQAEQQQVRLECERAVQLAMQFSLRLR